MKTTKYIQPFNFLKFHQILKHEIVFLIDV